MIASIQKIIPDGEDVFLYKCIDHNDFLCVKCLTTETIFINSCFINYFDTAKLLIENNKIRNINLGLKSACRGGNFDLSQFLMEHGADDYIGAFINACRGKANDIAQYFGFFLDVKELINGLNISIKNDDMETTKIIFELIDNNVKYINIHLPDLNEQFILACKYNRINMLNFFPPYNINIHNGLIIASTYGLKKLLTYLITSFPLPPNNILSLCVVSCIANRHYDCLGVLPNCITPELPYFLALQN